MGKHPSEWESRRDLEARRVTPDPQAFIVREIETSYPDVPMYRVVALWQAEAEEATAFKARVLRRADMTPGPFWIFDTDDPVGRRQR